MKLRPVLLLRRYPYVIATLLVAATAGVILLTPAAPFSPWLLGGFAIVVAARSAWRMVRELRSGTFGVDILAVTAICAAVAVGEYWAALVIVLMLTGGEALEDYAAHRAERDLRALLSRAPQTGHRYADDGTTVEVPINEIAPGDRIMVRPGEIVPVDGTLVSAEGSFDESSITGESLLVDKVAGDEVLSGGVNGAAAVMVQATRAAKDSQYQQIVTLVEAATASKSPIVRLADRYAIPFTLLALAIAGTAWAVSGDAVRFAEVLVVATPCPLIIAAPVAFMAGMSRAARDGVIVKSSATLETFRRAKTFAFDKTGTLTQGEPSLVEVRPEGETDADELLRFAASAEQFSAHVLAAAVLRAARAKGIELWGSHQVEESTAHGVTATIDGRTVVVGKRSFIAAACNTEVAATPLETGEMAVYVAVDGVPAGALVFADQVRQNARSTIASIRSQGIGTVVMLTGDDRATAEHVGTALGVDDIRSNCLPADKVTAVATLTERPVVMVGDGVNDAPVLAAADIGIAMGARGATAASESADVVLLRDDISGVAAALLVGRETVRVALQSIWVGMSLSIGLMCVAAAGLLPAIVGAWLQEAVDVISILWALRATRGSESPVAAATDEGEQMPDEKQLPRGR
ncbi:heavy metal translocating P-type ATPase [Salinibacterium hongtaonis]|uniref:Heavy metal translocating P-type ATPase n=1 Tax=Homoserinimonas hongtaonis TaxID=2079791 RepID=A0A2U1T1F0_9MICO|nr:heavy metal translocating P-type ATPase [Salinibacterium hongtaonis]PWB97687.1 heavy metal translocating P-type ATPase [Salinibacterium hongtaonis]